MAEKWSRVACAAMAETVDRACGRSLQRIAESRIAVAADNASTREPLNCRPLNQIGARGWLAPKREARPIGSSLWRPSAARGRATARQEQ